MLLLLVRLCRSRRPHVERYRPHTRHRIENIRLYVARPYARSGPGASKIILSETIASAICFTDGKQVLASWGEDSAKCPAGTPVVLRTTLNVINSGEQSVFSRDASTETGGYFPRLRAGIVAPLTVRGHCVGTLELYYPRLSSIDMRQTALASGFADLISTQLASFELERRRAYSSRGAARLAIAGRSSFSV